MKRIAIAQNTIEILECGNYISPNGNKVDIAPELKYCWDFTGCYHPDNLSNLEKEVISRIIPFSKTEFEVKNETTLAGAERIAKTRSFERIGVLNFASAKNPGGGVLNGSQAQEESLARSSALYKSLLKCSEYYNFHRSQTSLLYSNYMIYSPSCPVFKNDNGELLEEPYCVEFLTSPAPNAGMVHKNQQQDIDKIPNVLRDRASKVLSLATYKRCDALILGAWGCGVFKNDPAMAAQVFADLLLPNGQFWGKFKSVIFSVFDSNKQQENFLDFHKQFSGN